MKRLHTHATWSQQQRVRHDLLPGKTSRTSVTVPVAVSAAAAFICISSAQSTAGPRPESFFPSGYLTDGGDSGDNNATGASAPITSTKGDSATAQHTAGVGASHDTTL